MICIPIPDISWLTPALAWLSIYMILNLVILAAYVGPNITYHSKDTPLSDAFKATAIISAILLPVFLWSIFAEQVINHGESCPDPVEDDL